MRRLRWALLRGISYLITLSGLAFLIGGLWLSLALTVRDLGIPLWQAALIQLGCPLLVAFLPIEAFIGAYSRLWRWLHEKRGSAGETDST
jgi:hypothetical protein